MLLDAISYSGIQSIIQSAAASKPQVESAAATTDTDNNTVDPFVEVAESAPAPALTSESSQESEDADASEAVSENFINSSLLLSSASGGMQRSTCPIYHRI